MSTSSDDSISHTSGRGRKTELFGIPPDGQEITRDVEHVESIIVGQRKVARTLRRKEPITEDDLPVIADRYRAFRREHQEPSA